MSPASRMVVLGGVGIDDVITLPGPLTPGGFTQATAHQSRPAGCALNVATALASTGRPTVLVGCVGTDYAAQVLLRAAVVAGVEPRLRTVAGPSARSLVLVEPDGERTIIGVTDGLLDQLDTTGELLNADDVLVLPSWRPSFAELLAYARALGCLTVVGLRALADPAAPQATVAVGAERELGDVDPIGANDRFGTIVVTAGVAGASAHQHDVVLHQPALPASALDATGAGDAFLAGFVHTFTTGVPLSQCLLTATAWGGATVEVASSVPPPWSQVRARLEALR